MEISISSTNDEKLFNRKTILFSVSYEGSTASKDSVKVELCKRLNLKPDCTVISSMEQGFGSRQSAGSAHAYSDEQSMRKFEPAYVMKRAFHTKDEKEAPAEAVGAKKQEAAGKAKKR